jgi:hypothetical protein
VSADYEGFLVTMNTPENNRKARAIAEALKRGAPVIARVPFSSLPVKERAAFAKARAEAKTGRALQGAELDEWLKDLPETWEVEDEKWGVCMEPPTEGLESWLNAVPEAEIFFPEWPDQSARAFEPEVRKFLAIISAQAERAIGDVDRPGFLQLSRVHPTATGLVPSRFVIGNVDAMVKLAVSDANAGHNVYVEARTVRQEVRGKGRGELKDTEWVFALVIDSDADKGMDAGALPLEPSLIVQSSSGNFRYWYFVDQAIRADQAKIIGAAIRASVSADHDTGTVTQPYRVAGTTNFPGKAKRERGRTECQTHIFAHSDRQYTPSELLAAFQPTQQSDNAAGPDSDASDQEFNYSWVIEGLLPNDLLKLIRDGIEDDDRSKVFFSVVARLKNKFWCLDDIVALFEKYPQGIAKKYAGRVREETKRVYDKIKSARDKLPIITIRKGEQTKIVGEIGAALHKAGVPVFERSGALVYPRNEVFEAGKGRKTVVTTLAQYKPATIHLDIDRSAQFIEWKKVDGHLEPCIADPPPQITNLVLGNERHWQFRPIISVIMTPLLRQDGSIIGGNQTLYDAVSRLYYVPSVTLPEISERPSQDEGRQALQWLHDERAVRVPTERGRA